MVTEKRTILDGIRQKVFLDRYALKDAGGNPIEEYPEEMWRRVAFAIASVEKTKPDQDLWEKRFYHAMADFKFVPGGRILSGAGTGFDVTCYNCYVIESPHDSREGIIDNLKIMTEIMARGGGVGINLSTLRPRGSYIKTVNGTASGPCSWAQLYSVATGDVIQQGGCFGPHVEIETDRGVIAASDLADLLDSGEDVQALTHKGYHPITAVFRNGKKKLFQVKTYSGFEIEVTKDHKMGVLRDDTITTVPLEHLRIGSSILRFRKESSTCHPTSISSITPIGEHETFDFEVADVHLLVANGLYTSNSRRGALMLMLNDNHPDIEEFITVKKQKGMIEHANLSICVSDSFMKAVEHDADWNLIWDDKVQKTVKARSLWDLICTSAWESAEPGLVFMERCNEQSNTWYYEKINCVNPCVAGDTLVSCFYSIEPIPIKELAERGKDVRVECFDKERGTREIRLGRSPRLTRKDAEVWKLTLDDGSVFRATPDHKMLLANGEERQLQDLQVDDYLASYVRKEGVSPTTRQVAGIVPYGREDVYNITVDDYHTVAYITNAEKYSGIFAMNCGEQPLGDWGVCNLGAINLAAFVEDETFDYTELRLVTREAMRFLDNVIDATTYFIPENKEAQLGTRRTGLGTMGLADALIKMRISYGSLESLTLIESIYTNIRNVAYETSAHLAGEKGAFPKYSWGEYKQGYFIERLPSHIRSEIAANGIRNAVLLTQAPTGTTSLFAGVSSGIEPVYDFAMIRRDRTGEHVMYHPLMQKWLDTCSEKTHGSLPSYFVSSKDLTPEQHVAVQARIQKFTDASISKTVNAPSNHTVEQVKKLYQLAYNEGCKGITYYRDGSRDAVLTRIADEKILETPQVAEIFQRDRPEIVYGYTRQIQAPEGKANVTINSDEAGLFEVFINVGKAGSDIAALSEALGRLISLNLQIPSLLSPEMKTMEIIKQLRGIGGSRTVGFGTRQVRSLPDAVARTLELHSSRVSQAESAEIISDVIACMGCAAEPILTGNLCPECGCDSVVREEGCKKCHICGYSEC
jgi:ribonucleotide reductase alpha subunit